MTTKDTILAAMEYFAKAESYRKEARRAFEGALRGDGGGIVTGDLGQDLHKMANDPILNHRHKELLNLDAENRALQVRIWEIQGVSLTEMDLENPLYLAHLEKRKAGGGSDGNWKISRCRNLHSNRFSGWA